MFAATESAAGLPGVFITIWNFIANLLPWDLIFFVVLPYVALVLFFFMTIYRYLFSGFSYSSLSSQFLENRQHFWGIVPFHLGILWVLAGHFIAFLIPRSILAWNAHPVRLYVLEVSALIGGLLALVGLLNLMYRRLTHPRVKQVTSAMDWVVLSALALQILSGVFIAVFARWGSSWYASTMSPYLWSLFTLDPQPTYITGMGGLLSGFNGIIVKFHVVLAWLIIGLFPFTRLVHILVVPNPYLWRRPQVVIWNYNRKSIRNPD